MKAVATGVLYWLVQAALGLVSYMCLDTIFAAADPDEEPLTDKETLVGAGILAATRVASSVLRKAYRAR